MTSEEKYLFDLQGYLYLPQVLPKELVHRLNSGIDRFETLDEEETAALGIMRKDHDEFWKGEKKGRNANRPRDYDCNILRLGGPFEELIDCPQTLPYIEEMISEPLRLDVFMYMARNQGKSSNLHHGYAELLAYCEYAFGDGQFKCVSVKIAYALTDVSIEEGAFTVMPGSHKSNFNNPIAGAVPDENHPLIEVCPCKAGDAVIFTEDLTHGAVVNQSNKTRRSIFISYAPAFQSPKGKLAETADGFEDRANPKRLELIKGPSPFVLVEA